MWSFQHEVSYGKRCMTWSLPEIEGGGQIQFQKIHEWTVCQTFAPKIRMCKYKHITFLVLMTVFADKNYFSEIQFLLVMFQEWSFQDNHKSQLCFLGAILLFYISPLFYWDVARLSLRNFPCTEHHHVLNMYKSCAWLLSFDQSFQLVTCSIWKINIG